MVKRVDPAVRASVVARLRDKRATGGSIRADVRDWASFTHTAVKLCAEHGRERLDAEIARNTFAVHGSVTGA